MCGGPSQQAKDAASSQADLDKQLTSQFKAGSAVTQPFYTDMVNKGLPFFNAESQYGTSSIAKDINQQQAMMKNRLAGEGSALPSGFAESAQRDLAEGGAQAFDQNQLALLQAQQNAKLMGAQGLNPMAAAGLAQGGNQSLINMPRNSFWENLIGGMVSGASQVGSAYAGRPG